jgi:phosphoglycerol transferase MdoB-like AlkP superfamily enzyme
VAQELNHLDGPFFATLYTLTSHHPFQVPAEYDQKVAQGNFPMQHTVAYTDEALRQFFAQVSQTDWYNRTLFVITADHCTFEGAKDVDYQKHRYSVPMIFYHPAQAEVFHSDEIMQQVDIMPSIFGYCGFKGAFVSFGNNVFDSSTPRFAINYLSGTYQFYISHYLIEFNGDKILKIWDLEKEGNQREIPSEQVPQIKEYERLMKAVIQQYHEGLLHNKLKNH